MITLLLGLSLGAAPPHVDLSDTGRWERAAEAFLDGPPGCWEVVGYARWDYDFARFGAAKGSAIFVARLDDGVWEDFTVVPQGEIVRRGPQDTMREYSEEQHFAPLMGQMRVARQSQEHGGPVNLLRLGLDRIAGDVEVNWAEWVDEGDDGAGVVLRRAVPIGDDANAPEAEVRVFFPQGGDKARTMNVDMPAAFKVGKWPTRATIRDAVLEMRAKPLQGSPFPTAEAWSANFSMMGYKGHGAQTIAYRSAVPCGWTGPLLPQAEEPDDDRGWKKRRHRHAEGRRDRDEGADTGGEAPVDDEGDADLD